MLFAPYSTWRDEGRMWTPREPVYSPNPVASYLRSRKELLERIGSSGGPIAIPHSWVTYWGNRSHLLIYLQLKLFKKYMQYNPLDERVLKQYWTQSKLYDSYLIQKILYTHVYKLQSPTISPTINKSDTLFDCCNYHCFSCLDRRSE